MTDNRTTAERIAREVANEFSWVERAGAARDMDIALVLAGMAHRDRTAEREAAKKAWDAAVHFMVPVGDETWRECQSQRDRYLAREFDAGERATLSDGSVVIHTPDNHRNGFFWRRSWEDGSMMNARDWQELLGTHISPADTGADFDKLKAFAAEQRGAER